MIRSAGAAGRGPERRIAPATNVGRPRRAVATSVHRNPWAACLSAVLLMATAEGSFAQAPIKPSDACLAVNRNLSLGASLPRTTARLKAGDPLRVVAVGSSSTSGLWVLSSAATYPEVMRRELVELQPATRVEIINSGRIGETTTGASPASSATSSPINPTSSFGSSAPTMWPGAGAPKVSRIRLQKGYAG
jgi:hypothetical protein